MSEQDADETGWFAAYADLDREAAEQRAEADGRRVRVLPPGSMMTMDHRPDRLNVEVDEAGALVRLWPG